MPRSITARSSSLPALVGLALWLMSSAAAAPAQTCVGDCRGLGRVAISDLVLAVSILLGQAPPSACPALGPGPVTVAKLIASVNSALCACAPCPTPPPTRTFTATPLPTATPLRTATPVATPSPGPIVSNWREDGVEVAQSNCPRQLTDQIRAGLASVVTEYIVRRYPDRSELAEVNGDTLAATVDPDGTLRASDQAIQREGNCVVTVDLALTVDIGDSPTPATYVAVVSARGCPTTLNCRLRISARWTRTDAARQAAGRRSVIDVLRVAIPSAVRAD